MDQKAKAALVLKNNFQNFLFVFPAFFIFCVFYIYPFFNMIYLSLHQWNWIGAKHFIWFQNYTEIMGDRVWWDSMGHAFYITLIALTFQNFLAFALALACDREIRMK